MNKSESGQVFVLAVIVLTLVMVNILVIISGAFFFRKSSNYSISDIQAINLAEAGVDKAVASLNQSGGTFAGDSETTLGVGSFESSVDSVSSDTKIVTSTGYIPSKANATTERTIRIQVSKGKSISFDYAVQTGEGGFQIGSNSSVGGLVYSNGDITMGGSSTISKDVYVAGGAAATPDQQTDCTDPNCADFLFGKNVSGNDQLDVAQSFKPSANNSLSRVSLKLKKIGSPNDLTVRILADSSGKPDKSNILSSGTLLSSQVTDSYSFVDVSFSSPPILSSSDTYWILLDSPSDSSNYYSWEEDTTQGYTRGNPEWSPNWQDVSPVWNSISGDLSFKTYVNGTITKLVGSQGATVGGNAHAHDIENLTISGGAYFQTDSGVTASTLHPGSDDPVAKVFPISDVDIQDWKNQASSNTQGGDISSCVGTLSSGKYVGSVTLPDNCTITITPPIWITGNLSLGSGDSVKIDSSFGGSSGVLLVSGKTTINTGNHLTGTGTAGSYLILLSDYNSRDDPLNANAIDLTGGSNSGEFYSNLGTIHIASGNTLSQVSAWKGILDSGGMVNLDSGLSSAFFSSPSGGSFSAVKGTYQLK